MKAHKPVGLLLPISPCPRWRNETQRNDALWTLQTHPRLTAVESPRVGSRKPPQMLFTNLKTRSTLPTWFDFFVKNKTKWCSYKKWISSTQVTVTNLGPTTAAGERKAQAAIKTRHTKKKKSQLMQWFSFFNSSAPSSTTWLHPYKYSRKASAVAAVTFTRHNSKHKQKQRRDITRLSFSFFFFRTWTFFRRVNNILIWHWPEVVHRVVSEPQVQQQC